MPPVARIPHLTWNFDMVEYESLLMEYLLEKDLLGSEKDFFVNVRGLKRLEEKVEQ